MSTSLQQRLSNLPFFSISYTNMTNKQVKREDNINQPPNLVTSHPKIPRMPLSNSLPLLLPKLRIFPLLHSSPQEQAIDAQLILDSLPSFSITYANNKANKQVKREDDINQPPNLVTSHHKKTRMPISNSLPLLLPKLRIFPLLHSSPQERAIDAHLILVSRLNLPPRPFNKDFITFLSFP